MSKLNVIVNLPDDTFFGGIQKLTVQEQRSVRDHPKAGEVQLVQ